MNSIRLMSLVLLLLLLLKAAFVEFGVGGAHLQLVPLSAAEAIRSDSFLDESASNMFNNLVLALMLVATAICIVRPRAWMPLMLCVTLHIVSVQVFGSFVWTPPDFALNALFFTVAGAILSNAWRSTHTPAELGRAYIFSMRFVYGTLLAFAIVNAVIGAPVFLSSCSLDGCLVSTRALVLTIWIVVCFMLGVAGLVGSGRNLLLNAITSCLLSAVAIVLLLVRAKESGFGMFSGLGTYLLIAVALSALVLLKNHPFGWGNDPAPESSCGEGAAKGSGSLTTNFPRRAPSPDAPT